MPDRLLVDLNGDGQARVSSWPDGGLPEEVSRVPLAWPLDADALEDLRWYLEDYLLAPYGVWEERGPAVREKLAGWGDLLFGSVFSDGPARFAYERARDRGLEMLFRSSEPALLGLPWELMRDGAGPVALGAGGVSRSLPVAGGAGTLEVPGGKLRVLMVISRPAGASDVGYQMVARPLLQRLDAVRGEVSLTVLRPPTFGALRDAVRQAAGAGEPFHVVHFDGHGAMPGRPAGGRPGSGGAAGDRPPMMTGPGEGVLAFEQPGGGSDQVGASKVAAVLAEGKVPVVVLNACQSGAVGKELEASVATALLKSGCAAVAAMAYSVYAVAAAEFMAAFYESLFAGESVGQAVTAGRRRLFEHDGRPSPKGDMPLADWLVPVHYLRREVRFPDARTTRPAAAPSLDEALDQIRAAPSEVAAQDPLAAMSGVFVGRDDLLYQLEAAARLQRVVILTGPGGTGKTELAKGFARWWRETGGTDDPRLVCWHSFEPGVASFGLDGVVNSIGLQVFGADFARLEAADRLAAVQRLLAEYRGLLAWDNFESVAEMPDPDGATPPLDEAGRAERQAAGQALRAACAAFSRWLTGQVGSGNAALAYTLLGLQRRTLGAMLGHALDHRAWDDAEDIVRALDAYWETRGLGGEAAAWADRILAATAGPGQGPAEAAKSLWLYTLGHQAERQRAAGQPDQAARAYRQVLTWQQEQPQTESTRGNIAVTYHQLGVTAQDRGRLDEAEDLYRRSLAIKEELGDRPGMALTYAQLGLLAEARDQAPEALAWNIRCVTLFDDFPSPLTGTGPSALARLTQKLGIPALEQAWQQVTGQLLPPAVRDWVIGHNDPASQG